jgi:hypothetical protein
MNSVRCPFSPFEPTPGARRFIPEHVMLWEKFPVWYHLAFLLSLVPLTYVGGRFGSRPNSAVVA